MKMSTYLVAFSWDRSRSPSPSTSTGCRCGWSTRRARPTSPGYALEVAAHALRFFSDYFAIPYPADKLDLVAIPDFAFGAMENLGCVTFRETALLVDPAKAARTELERIADVVSHEIAHMWFGDLVTMRWWEGIWLNEAFATFMEVLCVDAFRPAWERWVSFGLEREAALAVDGLHTTRPIEYPVGSPEEADGMFDVLTYQKGGSVLRMLEQYLGPEVFRDGVRRYLTDHAYANTVTSDLWDALEAVSGQPVRETDGLVDPPGRPPAGDGRRGHPRSVPLRLHPAPRRRGERHRRAMAGAGAPAAGGRRGHGAADAGLRFGGGAPGDDRQRRRLGRLPRRLRGRSPGLRRASPSSTPWSDRISWPTPGRWCSPAEPVSNGSWPWRRRWAGRTSQASTRS